MIDVALLGCGGSMPIPNRFLTALMISYRGRKILIDCGEGTQVSMKMLGWGFKTIDIICITHFHADHIVGLPGLLATIRNSERTQPLIIIGPKGLKDIYKGLSVIIPYLPYEVILIESDRGEYSFQFTKEGLIMDENQSELIITTLPLNHSSICLGYSFYLNRKPAFDLEKATSNQVPKLFWNRLQHGEIIESNGVIYEPQMVLGSGRRGIKISYITDTRPFRHLIDFVRNSDLLISEGMYGDDADLDKAIHNKHMTFSEAAHIAKEASANELVLTHFSPSMGEPEIYLEKTKGIFSNTTLGTDRLLRSLNFVNEK